jgi:hypothetical protein
MIATSLFFFAIGLYFTIIFWGQLEFSHNPLIWFTAPYYQQFIPFYIGVTLLLGRAFLLAQYSKANLYLAIFGHMASEEILFHWIGLTSTELSKTAIMVFFPLSIIALWIAYGNVLKQKKLSLVEAFFGFIFSTALILLPRYL